jgi:hypothetical protein
VLQHVGRTGDRSLGGRRCLRPSQFVPGPPRCGHVAASRKPIAVRARDRERRRFTGIHLRHRILPGLSGVVATRREVGRVTQLRQLDLVLHRLSGPFQLTRCASGPPSVNSAGRLWAGFDDVIKRLIRGTGWPADVKCGCASTGSSRVLASLWAANAGPPSCVPRAAGPTTRSPARTGSFPRLRWSTGRRPWPPVPIDERLCPRYRAG